MATSFENEHPSSGPVTQRLFLIEEIDAAFTEHEPDMAVYVSPSLQFTMALCGEVETFKSDNKEYYRGLGLCLFNTGPLVQVLYLESGNITGCINYPMHPTQESLGALTRKHADADIRLRHLLARCAFTPHEAHTWLKSLFSLPPHADAQYPS
jgi:hypothetical protein